MLLILGSVCLVLLVLSLFVVGSVARDLLAAREALEGSLEDIDRSEVMEAREHLESAAADLDGWIAEGLGLLPVVGTNLHAVEEVTDNALPVLDSAIGLQDAVDSLDEEGLVEEGRVQIEEIEALSEPLATEVQNLDRFAQALDEARSGVLAPPLWDAIERLRRRVLDLHDDATQVERAVELSGALLGEGSKRTYLLVLLNNAELRGGGGIVAGLGSLTVSDGQVKLGELYTREQLDQDPRLEVPAPAEYDERFGLYAANTTLWYNTVMTPHFPDAALVAARLFAKQKNIEADGVLGVDPLALAALTPPGVEVEVPGRDYTLEKDELSDWIFSDAYEDFTNQRAGARPSSRSVVMRSRPGSTRGSAAGKVSTLSARRSPASTCVSSPSNPTRKRRWRPPESRVRSTLRRTTRCSLPCTTSAVEERSAASSTYWTDRSIRHGCVVEGDGGAECATEVTFDNTVPDGLSRYVAGRPYGLLRNYAEVYIPGEARLQEVKLEGEAVEYRPEEQGDLLSVAVYVEIPQGDKAAIEVDYTLPAEDESYSLTMIPQPLTSDATVNLRLRVPNDWTIVGAGEDNELGELDWSTELDRTIVVEAFPDGRTGIPGIWEGFKDFWHHPLF